MDVNADRSKILRTFTERRKLDSGQYKSTIEPNKEYDIPSKLKTKKMNVTPVTKSDKN